MSRLGLRANEEASQKAAQLSPLTAELEMERRNHQRFERRTGRALSQGAPGGDQQPSATISNLPWSFVGQIWDKFCDHLAELIALAVFGVLAGAYFLFVTKIQVAESHLERIRVSALSATLTAIAAGAVCGIVTAVFLRWRFRRITDELRRRIASMERESALEQTNEQKVRTAVEEAIASAAEAPEDLALILVDIDDFRRLNNEYSYDVGTFVLRQCARAPELEHQRIARPGDALL